MVKKPEAFFSRCVEHHIIFAKRLDVIRRCVCPLTEVGGYEMLGVLGGVLVLARYLIPDLSKHLEIINSDYIWN